MSKLYKFLLVIAIASIVSFNASAQQNYWSSRSESSVGATDKAVARQSFPKEFKLFQLSVSSLRQELFSIVGDQARSRSTIISLPNATGGMEQFEVFEASNFDPVLQARFPQIRAYSGRGITDKAATLKLSISPKGIQTMVFRKGDQPNEYMEPYSNDGSVYAVFRAQRNKGSLPWVCSTPDADMASGAMSQAASMNRIESSAGELRVFRLAQSCNGEYANWFGATSSAQVALVLAAFNATYTRVNGCLEKDLAIHLNIIDATTQVIYYDPTTDPYSVNLGNWNNQLMNTLHNVLGDDAFDIGHMFGASGGGGNAGCIGCVCSNVLATGNQVNSANSNYKGGGITSPADQIPQGDNFDIDYVVHEIGHQLGANHTFSMDNESTGRNKEVGSGITIMGYAGITNQDVAPHSIDIFHQTSIEQVQGHISTRNCAVITSQTGLNSIPVVTPVINRTIPVSTPFALTGSATDADPGDVLTYCWEQNDNSTTIGNASVASPTKLTGPNWLSFSPTTSPIRLFPRLSTILTGASVTGPLPGGDAIANIEALSSIGRTLNFRLTVRDNRPYNSSTGAVGQTAFTDVVVTVNAATGPFLISTQNSAVSYQGGTTQTVSWLVNGTTGAPINCAFVNILFSSDGGQTFPTVLAANTANDGTEDIVIPTVLTTTGRIKVEAIGNIFFDINNANITVTAPPTGFNFNSPAPATTTCPAGATMAITLGTTSTGGFSNPVTLSATAGVPAGTSVTFGTNPVTPGNSSIVTLNNTNTLAAGTYVITITGTATGAPNQTRDLTFTITGTAGPAITTQPSNSTICVTTNTSFSIASAGATSFQWQLSTDGGTTYNNVANAGVYSGATTNTLTITGATIGLNNNRYRCIASTQCGSSTSNAGILSVNAAPAVTAQPQDITLCAGSNHTFNVTATGAGLTYQWQLSTDGGGTYNNISNGGIYSGATSGSLTLTGLTAGLDGNRYRCVVSGSCTPPVNSNGAMLTVVTSVTVTTQPSDATVCEGSNSSFTVAGSGSGIIYQWQVSTDGGTTWTNVANAGVYSSATTATLNITGATFAMNTYRYRCQLSNSTCTTPGVSNAGILTVNTLPAVTSNPANSTICLGGNTSFSTAATGTGIGYQWQVSTDGGTTYTNITNGGVYAGATTTTLTITGATAAMNSYRYRVVVTGTCAPAANSTGAVLTVINPVAITTQPANSEICSGSNTSFSVTGSSTQTIIYQWQVNPGTGFVNVANAAPYSGATTATLTITGATTTISTYQYRCILSNATCSGANQTTSGSATLTVRQLPTVTLAAAPLTALLPGQSTTLTATPSASTGGVLTTSWFFNTNPVANTGNTRIVNVEQVGDYQVRIQETWPSTLVCSNQSAVVAITAQASERLFIFPSPNDGAFQVAYYNSTGASSSRTITIYNAAGAKVHHEKFAVTGSYTLLNLDIKPAAKGLYYVVVGDASGKRIAKGNVLIQ